VTRRIASGVLAWLLAVAVATGVGVAAVSVIGSGIVGSGPQPLSAAEVNAQLASLPTVPPATTPASTTAPANPPAADSKVFSVPGGTIIARCAPGGVEIVSATPAQGFHVSGDIEIDDHPKVRFRSGRDDFEVRFRCVSGLPAIESR
jgi:serine/threonine-protein kinase